MKKMSSYVTRKTPGDTAWFVHDRFGMFIHWGIYALPARHEWIKMREMISEEHYDLYMRYFDPDLYDAREWARQAKAAGMKYAVMTTNKRTGRPGPDPGICRCLPGRRDQDRFLLLPD